MHSVGEKTGSNYVHAKANVKTSPGMDRPLRLQEVEALRHSGQSAH